MGNALWSISISFAATGKKLAERKCDVHRAVILELVPTLSWTTFGIWLGNWTDKRVI